MISCFFWFHDLRGSCRKIKEKNVGRFKLSEYLEKRPRDLALESYVFTFKTLV